ncbi:unnamed protein product, partial [Penicillium salamii]
LLSFFILVLFVELDLHVLKLCRAHNIYKDQNPEFFVSKGIKPGIARSFVENIRDWAENVKKGIPVIEMI